MDWLTFNKVWCIGLPKSGTTLIESILEELPYVEMFTSILRKWENSNPKYMFDLNVPEELFKDMPDNRNTYCKTHTKLTVTAKKIINDHNGIINFIPIKDGAKIEIIFKINANRNSYSWW